MGGGWPWEAIAAVAGLLLTHLVRPAWKLVRSSGEQELRIHEQGWQRARELEEEVTLLRIALHRNLRDRNAYATAIEVVIASMHLPLDERIRAIRQAREILEGTLPIGGGASSP